MKLNFEELREMGNRFHEAQDDEHYAFSINFEPASSKVRVHVRFNYLKELVDSGEAKHTGARFSTTEKDFQSLHVYAECCGVEVTAVLFKYECIQLLNEAGVPTEWIDERSLGILWQRWLDLTKWGYIKNREVQNNG